MGARSAQGGRAGGRGGRAGDRGEGVERVRKHYKSTEGFNKHFRLRGGGQSNGVHRHRYISLYSIYPEWFLLVLTATEMCCWVHLIVFVYITLPSI